MSHRDRSIANMRCEAKRIYNQRRYINKIEKENKQLKEENNKKLDRLINLEEKILDYQGRLSLIKITIKNFLCTEEYINVDGNAISNNYGKLLEILKGDNNE